MVCPPFNPLQLGNSRVAARSRLLSPRWAQLQMSCALHCRTCSREKRGWAHVGQSSAVLCFLRSLSDVFWNTQSWKDTCNENCWNSVLSDAPRSFLHFLAQLSLQICFPPGKTRWCILFWFLPMLVICLLSICKQWSWVSQTLWYTSDGLHIQQEGRWGWSLGKTPARVEWPVCVSQDASHGLFPTT